MFTAVFCHKEYQKGNSQKRPEGTGQGLEAQKAALEPMDLLQIPSLNLNYSSIQPVHRKKANG